MIRAARASLLCVSLVEPTDVDNIYRTTCSEVLAWALFELGAPAGVEVPLITLGPLALALMDEATGHYDREAARHVGELLLARAPLALEAPQVLERLKRLSSEPRMSSLVEIAKRDYGDASPWLEAQRHRLAPQSDSLEQLEKALLALRPSGLGGKSSPREPPVLREELGLRASLSAEWCAHEFARTQKVSALSVRVDTTGSRPTIKVTPNGNKPFVRCLERQAALFFRGLGPSRIRFKVVGPPEP